MSVRLSLDIWLDGYDAPAGKLDALDNGDVEFRYRPEFLRAGRPLSLSLPLDDAPVGDLVARPFFDNLLPESNLIQQVMDREGLQRSEIVGILYHIGADCSGAISCLPTGSPPIKVPGNLGEDYRPLPKDEIETIVRRLANREAVGDIDPSAVAGVQSKISLTLLPDGQFALPAPGRKVPATHILKVPRLDEASEALQEAAAIQLARGCGFDTSRSDHVVIEGIQALLIERYDRVVQDGVVYRLHQEDFAQALALPSGLKYQRAASAERIFDAKAIYSVLQGLDHPAQAIQNFLLITFFNLAIGNNDNHAKNHSILYGPDGTPRLAPFYDLLPIQLNKRYTDQLAFDIGRAQTLEAISGDDISAFLELFGLAGGRAERFVQGKVKSMLAHLEKRSRGLRSAGLRLFDDLIGREMSHLNDVLDLGMELRERDYFTTTGGGWGSS
ncbi:HipA domain-containing protein [Novosphingobium terrae]|uniref:HipA domain-containing protein n=1 Tax=Novosphingobium terrae TaxID=2726189 RepID=UPI00197FF720|nr:HipA domain-containing protein [Novosphingobium terrae]